MEVPPPSRREDHGEDGYGKTPFLSILLYVMGFMAAIAAIAFISVWLLRR